MNYYRIFQYFLIFLSFIESEQLPSWNSIRQYCFGAKSSTADTSTSRNRARFSRYLDGNGDGHDGYYQVIFRFLDGMWHYVHLGISKDKAAFEGKDTVPLEYRLNIIPDLSAATFKGTVTIKIRLDSNEPTRTIELDFHQLTIHSVTVSTSDKKPKKIKSTFELDSNSHKLIITAKESLTYKSFYDVQINYSGRMYRYNPFGLAIYQSNNERRMAETVFDPLSLSYFFPSYDGYLNRIPISITLDINIDERVVSNLASQLHPITRDNRRFVTLGAGLGTDEVVHDFPINEAYFAILGQGYINRNKDEQYFVWTTEEYIDQVSYALDNLANMAEKMRTLLKQQEDYVTKINIVIPIRHSQQTGILSFVKKNLLCDPQFCSELYQEGVTRSVAYQVSKKWFGEYVSLRFWDNLWLREGLRTFYKYRLTDMIKSNWRVSDIHGSIVMQSTLYDDCTKYRSRLSNNNKKQEIFQRIHEPRKSFFYNNKASLILRMLKHVVGESEFQASVNVFLDRTRSANRYLNSDSLWREFDMITYRNNDKFNLKETTLSDVMNRFTNNVGYPLLTASRSSKSPGVSVIHTKQSAYCCSSASDAENPEWIVPITMATKSNANFEDTTPIAWSTASNDDPLPTLVDSDEWFIINLQYSGYYRVNYSESDWALLIQQLKDDPKAIHYLNRVQLIADSHKLAIDNHIDTKIPIAMTAYLEKEDEPIVWLAALEAFKQLYPVLTNDSKPKYRELFLTLLKKEYQRIGFEMKPDDAHITIIWRYRLLKFLCWIGDKDCVEKATQKYNENIRDLSRINPNLQFVVFCTMLRSEKREHVGKAVKEMTSKNNNMCLQYVYEKASQCKSKRNDDNTPFGKNFDDLVPGDEDFELHEGGLDMGNELQSDELVDFQEMLEDSIIEVSAE